MIISQSFFDLSDSLTAATNKTKTITFRNIKAIDNVSFTKYISEALTNLIKEDFSSSVKDFNMSCINVMNKHAPIISKEIKERPMSPWFDGEYKSLRNDRRKAERKKHLSSIHFEN